MKKILYTLCIILLTALSITAQWSTNPSINNMLCNAPNNQTTTKMIADGEGGVIIVWEDYRTSTSNRDIYAQRINYAGIKQWGDSNGIPLGIRATNERWPDICTDGKGGALFIWDDNPTAYVTYIKGQRITKSGIKMWSDTGNVITYSGNRQTTGKIVTDNNGGFFIVYQTSEVNSSYLDLKVNRIDSNGNGLWGNGNFICQTGNNQYDLTAINTSDNGFAVSWNDYRFGIETDNDIFIQKISSTGSILWQINGLPVCIKKFAQQYSEMYPDNNGGVFVVWNDKRDSLQFDIYAQRIRSNGSIVGTADGVPICLDTSAQYRPTMVTDMKRGVYIVWYDYRNGPSFPFNIDIYAQRMDSSCNVKWVANGKNICDAQYSQINHFVVSDSAYGAVIAWDDRRAGTSIYDVYAQRIDSNGNLLWDPNDMPVSIATGNQYRPKIVSVSDGYIIMFEDTRNGINNYDLFFQKINKNGGMPLGISENQIYTVDFNLLQNYPNPFNPETKIKFIISKKYFGTKTENFQTTLNIYDILGRKVKTLVNKILQPGIYDITFNAEMLSGGIYFYKLTVGEYSETKKMVLVK